MKNKNWIFPFILLLTLSIGPQVNAVPVQARKIIISSESKEAVWAGTQIYKKGGNIVDAAVATALALAVSHPQSGSLGGGGFAMVKIGNQVEALDFREMAPQATGPDFYKDKDKMASINGALSVGVPGVVAGLFALHKKSGKLKWSELFEPALEIAGKGVRLTGELNSIVNENLKRLNDIGLETFQDNEGKQIQPGDIFKQDGLRAALEIVKTKGADGFYKGEVAKDIVSSLGTQGGVLTLQDLENYKPRWLTPLKRTFKGHDIYLMPPPSSGGIVLASALRLSELKELESFPPLTAIELHMMGEILSRSFRGRSFLGDPDFTKNPSEYLMSDEYLKEMAHTIGYGVATSLAPLKDLPLSIESAKPDKKSDTPFLFKPIETASEPSSGKAEEKPALVNQGDSPSETPQKKESTETTHYSLMDGDGNAIAITTTLNGNFGSGIFSHRFGISLNNQMDDFTTRPNEPNMFGLIQGEGNNVQPKKRPLSSMSPTVVVKDGKAVLAVGARGGPRIISAVYQAVYRVLVSNFDMDLALQTPRVHHQFLPNELYVDPSRVSPDVLRSLRDRGHEVKEQRVACATGVRRTSSGILEGAFDSRCEGSADGF
jgi:gamma-glutamyltranspeptidase/glutathione hydrolase